MKWSYEWIVGPGGKDLDCTYTELQSCRFVYLMSRSWCLLQCLYMLLIKRWRCLIDRRRVFGKARSFCWWCPLSWIHRALWSFHLQNRVVLFRYGLVALHRIFRSLHRQTEGRVKSTVVDTLHTVIGAWPPGGFTPFLRCLPTQCREFGFFGMYSHMPMHVAICGERHLAYATKKWPFP